MSLTTDIVHYYKFDSNAEDSVGSDDLTIDGATSTTSGKINGAYNYDGSDDFMYNEDIFDDAYDSGSISVWIKTDNAIDSSNSVQTMFISKIGGSGKYIFFYFPNSNTLGFYLRNGESSQPDYPKQSVTWSAGSWHHIVGTWDTSGMTLYIDGTSVDTSTYTDGWNGEVSNYKFEVGSYNNGIFNWDGVIDELGIWSRALTAVEVGQLYNGGDGTQYPFTDAPDSKKINCVSYWKFDGDATDSVGSNDGTITGATNGSSYGKINEGYNFDGNDYITLPDTFNPSAYTVSVWIKAAATSSPQQIIDNTGTAANKSFKILLYNNTLYFRHYDSSGSNHDITTSFSDTSGWHHILFKWDGTTTTAYIDNVSKGTSGVSSISTTNKMRFGARPLSSPDQYYTGNMDEVGIWSRALTSTEISELYNSGDGKQYPFSSTPTSGWTGTVNGVEDPSKVDGTAVADITSINGVE